MKYQAVLFDFDYTLGDATESVVAGYEYAFGALGLPIPSVEAVRHTVGYLLQDSYVMLSGESSPAPGRVDEFVRLFTERAQPLQVRTTKLLPGARELLESLHEMGISLGVVSSKRVGALSAVLKALKLHELMDFTIGGDEVHAPKPDPEGLLLAAEHFCLPREKVLYCGDHSIDAETARRAGIPFAAVLTGTTTRAEHEAYPHVCIASDLIQLKDWLFQ